LQRIILVLFSLNLQAAMDDIKQSDTLTTCRKYPPCAYAWAGV